eukprot:CAMPEP_0202467344 /NCGR_PEP_ID=MMETSP1360-20130828/71673_1 /ASSEMBLY_ACC=CAM_ASM_000848 /TAXON_ID=515479 /ORGANISM="Licmophora paradoxa, Strain CCMP2313" /LENGTH=52 /DNA_ID=CAMNT_0049091853 /DNA_START=84 /DNA_END=239 /DNA_ORIENTATION=+
MAVVWEAIAGILVRIFVDLYLALSGTDVEVDEGGYENTMVMTPFVLSGGFAQ